MQEKFKSVQMEMADDGNIHIYGLEDAGKQQGGKATDKQSSEKTQGDALKCTALSIAKTLAENGIAILESGMNEANLEEYYMNMVGGDADV